MKCRELDPLGLLLTQGLTLRYFRRHYGDGNKSVKKTIGLD